ncbi:MAG: putative dienelactone hydrolase [Labilithrix sp.]|nr:putative dienelactone hydrolase [Labilithrix sp.]
MTSHTRAPVPLDGFAVTTRSYDGRTLDVYRRGAGPAVLVMHEIPGITPQVAEFARVVADAGFTVFMPSLFGEPGRPISRLYLATETARACVRRELRIFASGASSPLVSSLRALGAEAFAELGGPGIGAIGMCLTGNFALAMMVDPFLLAPVLSQPSLPVGLTRKARRGLHVGDAELRIVKERAASGTSVLAMRFTGDPLCPRERFERLREELGEGAETIEIDSSRRNPHGIPSGAHSVVTTDLVDEAGHPTRAALDRVLAFLRERLLVPAPASGA